MSKPVGTGLPPGLPKDFPDLVVEEPKAPRLDQRRPGQRYGEKDGVDRHQPETLKRHCWKLRNVS